MTSFLCSCGCATFSVRVRNEKNGNDILTLKCTCCSKEQLIQIRLRWVPEGAKLEPSREMR
jgi:RNase P subunit RPR2